MIKMRATTRKTAVNLFPVLRRLKDPSPDFAITLVNDSYNKTYTAAMTQIPSALSSMSLFITPSVYEVQ